MTAPNLPQKAVSNLALTVFIVTAWPQARTGEAEIMMVHHIIETVAGRSWRRLNKLRGPKRLLPVAWLAGATIFSQDHSAAKDLDALAQFVAPAYTAMNFAAICARDRSWLLSQPRGSHGSALEYAEHVKNEAIASLTHDEAIIVLRAAADAARSRVRLELQALAFTDPSLQEAQVAAWCRDFVTKYIRSFIDSHDRDHQESLPDVDQTKR